MHNFTYTPAVRITVLNNCLLNHYPHPYHFPGEFHDFWEMIYAVEDGFMAAEGDKVYAMKKGDVIFHKPMVFHRMWSIEQHHVKAFIVGFCAEGTLMEQMDVRAFELNDEQQAALEQILFQVQQHYVPKVRAPGQNDYLYTMMTSGDELHRQQFVDSYQLFLMSLNQQHTPLSMKESSESDAIRIYQQTVQLLSLHLNGWITGEEIARQLGYSSSTIKRAFAHYSGIGIHKYLLKLKITEAVRLLCWGKTCNEVSQILGFSNQNYFSTAFKRETGFAPSHYQNIRAGNLPRK